MQATSSSLDKVQILKRQSTFIKKVLSYTYDPYKQYNVTSKTLLRKRQRSEAHSSAGTGVVGSHFPRTRSQSFTLFSLLDALNQRTITGYRAIDSLDHFMKDLTIDEEKLVYRIIDKNLEIRVGAKVLNKAIPGLIPEFNVALAQKYEPKLASFGEDSLDTWYASRKLDGVRCLAVVDDRGICKLYSRTGKEFTTLNKIKEAIETTNVVNTVFDGEVCLVDKNGDEDFQSVMRELKRKDHQIENPVFMMFDMIHKTVFDSGGSCPVPPAGMGHSYACGRKESEDHASRRDGSFISPQGQTGFAVTLLGKQVAKQVVPQEQVLSERYNALRSFCSDNPCDAFGPLDQAVVTDDRDFTMWTQKATDNNWEGVMLRKDVLYEGKRSKNLLKVKKFFDAEYKVVGFDVDEMRVLRFGHEDYIQMLSQVYIEHKGHRVAVGSGFTQEQRIKYTTENIIGKTITVQYFEETKNIKGGLSLRFPTVKHIYDNGRDY